MHRHTPHVFVLLAFMTFPGAALAAEPASAPQSGTVISEIVVIKGSCAVTRDGVKTLANIGDGLYADDILEIQIGTYVSIALDPDWKSIVSMTGTSELTKIKIRPKIVEVEHGGAVVTSSGKGNADILTPSALTKGGNGTFQVQTMQARSDIMVLEGRVTVHGRTSTGITPNAQEVGKGMKAATPGIGMGPTAPVKMTAADKRGVRQAANQIIDERAHRPEREQEELWERLENDYNPSVTDKGQLVF